MTPVRVCCAGEVWAGRPAKLLRKMEEGEAGFILRSADNYAILAALHAEENAKTFPELEADKARRRCAARGETDATPFPTHIPCSKLTERRQTSRACDLGSCGTVCWSMPNHLQQHHAGVLSSVWR